MHEIELVCHFVEHTDNLSLQCDSILITLLAILHKMLLDVSKKDMDRQPEIVVVKSDADTYIITHE